VDNDDESSQDRKTSKGTPIAVDIKEGGETEREKRLWVLYCENEGEGVHMTKRGKLKDQEILRDTSLKKRLSTIAGLGGQ